MSRDVALALAERIRTARRDLLAAVSSGVVGLRDVLESSDPFTTGVKVVAVVESLPGLGKVAARRILEEVEIPGDCKIRDLGNERSRMLLDRLEG